MLIGFIVLTSKPDGKIHRLFYLIGVFAVLSTLHILIPMYTGYFKLIEDYGITAILIGCLWLIGMCFIPFIINYFFWNFPTPFKFVEKIWVRKAVFIIPAILSVLAILTAALTFNGLNTEMTFSL